MKTSSSTDMVKFFYQEFESLKAKTGIRQWEQLNELPDAAKVIHDVIEFMCRECDKPPFHVVRPEVKQRVISRAIVEDAEFIGLNAKFVNKALHRWWANNGDRIMEQVNKGSEIKPVDLSPEQKRKIDELANAYVAQILQGDGPKMVPKMDPDKAKKEGAEWVSGIEKKSVLANYQPPPDEYFETQDKIRKAGSALYRGRMDLNLKLFPVGQFQIFAESMTDAELIYQKAIK